MLCNSQKDDEMIADKMFECIEHQNRAVCLKKINKKNNNNIFNIYTNFQRFGVNMIFFTKLQILFSKDTLNWPKVTENVPKMLNVRIIIYFFYKCCSFALTVYLGTKSEYYNDFWRTMWHWRLDSSQE